METHSTGFKARLGLFVAGGIALFIIAIFYIGRQKHLFNPVFRISADFRNIGGLEIGNNVRFSGINVGTVDNIRIINDTTIRVDIIIDKETQQFIKTDCMVTIGSEGIIGDKIINITQGSTNSKVVEEGQYLSSVEPIQTDAILSSLKVTGENAEILSDQLAQILYKINNGKGTFGMLVNDSSIADNINSTIFNLKRSTKGLDENMEAAKHNILLRNYFKNKKKDDQDKQDGKNRKNQKTEPQEDKKEKKEGFFQRLKKNKEEKDSTEEKSK